MNVLVKKNVAFKFMSHINVSQFLVHKDKWSFKFALSKSNWICGCKMKFNENVQLISGLWHHRKENIQNQKIVH